MELLTLPAEILSRVLSWCDVSSRKALRLSNRLLNEVGKRWVFHTIHVLPTDESCERFESILDQPDLAAFVTKIYLNTFDIDAEDISELCEPPDDPDEDTGLPIRFYNLFDRLSELPRLKAVVLRFQKDATWEISDWVDTPQEVEQRDAIMKRGMRTFASLPNPLKDLAIRDLQDINTSDPTVAADIATVLGGLQSLRLNLTHEHREHHGEMDYKRDAPHVFYPELPTIWLKRTTANLQHLTIYSALYCGFYPKLDFRDIHLPQLKTLSLGNYGFVHDSQLDWILAHGATLTELYLEDCGIIHEVSIGNYKQTLLDPSAFEKRPYQGDYMYASYNKRWADYFRAFKDNLPNLQHFRYGHGDGWWEDDQRTPFETETEVKNNFHEESYMVFCDGFGPSPYMSEMVYRVQEGDGIKYQHAERVTVSEEDKQAFQELCITLGQAIPSFEPDDE
ncbi:hypothetical protein BJY04DRAFT_222681 [Aspergillus karnatakaensis]|uniref:uncharacterized protein n=1 Tax=Aspergillus karnatakaensis TaxID=1810916 RepID=UPI003CCC9BE4